MESTILDVTNKKVTNCAVPCYFVACGPTVGARFRRPAGLPHSGATYQSQSLTDFTVVEQVPLYTKRTSRLPRAFTG
jgi:hypothetical protein